MKTFALRMNIDGTIVANDDIKKQIDELNDEEVFALCQVFNNPLFTGAIGDHVMDRYKRIRTGG